MLFGDTRGNDWYQDLACFATNIAPSVTEAAAMKNFGVALGPEG
jgi:hypothetical protein